MHKTKGESIQRKINPLLKTHQRPPERCRVKNKYEHICDVKDVTSHVIQVV